MIRKYLSLFLCLLFVLSLVGLSLTSCDDSGEILDFVLEVLEETDEEPTSDISVETDIQDESDIQDEPDIPDETDIVAEPDIPPSEPEENAEESVIDEGGTYDDKENVALYIHTYGKLPPNYITKKEAQDLGWEGGSVEKYAPGKCIGGSVFGNYEGNLPDADGRTYRECDIDTLGESSRGAKRLVYSNDGLIYYTEDHYETFELLYGDE